MKYINYLFFFCALLALGACKNDKTVKNDPPPVTANTPTLKDTPVDGPVTINAIKQYVKEVDAGKDSLRQLGPSYYFKDKVKTQVIQYSNGIEPLIVFCQTQESDQFIYLYQRRPVFMREIAPIETGFQENRFYYGADNVLAAERREGVDPKKAKNGEAKTLTSKGADDYRFQVKEMNNLILKYLYNL
jgi:hypothetical protein